MLSMIWKYQYLFKFIILNCIDKLLLFVLPLFILFISNDKELYNDIEYIFSIANIIVVILNFMTLYAFYGYKQSEDRVLFSERVEGYFSVFLLIYSILGLALYPLINKIPISSAIGLLYIYIYIRTLYLLIINFYNVYYRLIDKPSKVFVLSIPVTLLSFLFIYLTYRLQLNSTIEAFFIPQMLVVLGGFIFFVLKVNKNIFIGLKIYLKSAAKYVFPLMINTLCVVFISNYGKIHAYHFLSENDMYKFSYVLRISMIIQMIHTSIIAYYSKAIFIDERTGVNKKVLTFYSLFLIASLFLSIIVLFAFNLLSFFDRIPIDISVGLILFYTIIHCLASFFEIYYNKGNKTIYILLFSLISCGIYLFLLLFVGVSSISSLSLYMVVYMTINMLLLLIFFNRIVNKIREC